MDDIEYGQLEKNAMNGLLAKVYTGEDLGRPGGITKYPRLWSPFPHLRGQRGQLLDLGAFLDRIRDLWLWRLMGKGLGNKLPNLTFLLSFSPTGDSYGGRSTGSQSTRVLTQARTGGSPKAQSCMESGEDWVWGPNMRYPASHVRSDSSPYLNPMGWAPSKKEGSEEGAGWRKTVGVTSFYAEEMLEPMSLVFKSNVLLLQFPEV